MKNYSCEVAYHRSEVEKFDTAKVTGRSDHNDFLNRLILAALAAKYTRDELVPLNRSMTPSGPASLFQEVSSAEGDDGLVRVSYAYTVPPSSTTAVRLADTDEPYQRIGTGSLVVKMTASTPLDARSGSALRAIRRKRGTPAENTSQPIGTSRNNRVRAVRETIWED